MTTALPRSEAASVSPSEQIELSETGRTRLYTCIHTGRTTARERTRAQVLLKLVSTPTQNWLIRAFDDWGNHRGGGHRGSEQCRCQTRLSSILTSLKQ